MAVISKGIPGGFVRTLRERGMSEDALGAAVALVIGIGAGLGAVLFRWMIDSFTTLFFDTGGEVLGFMGSAYVVVVPAIGGIAVGLLVYHGAREAKGHGVPEVMAAVAVNGGRIRTRVAVVKSLASAITIGSGGSVGREGPIVQIGSALGSTLGQRLHLHQDWVRTFVACGAAGGIAATFNAPIAGAFFALEIILRRYAVKSIGLVLVSSVTSAVIAALILGDEVAFTVPTYSIVSGWEFPLYAVLGVLAALVAFAFVFVLYGMEDLFDAVPIPEYIKPVFGGLAVGAIGFFYPQVFGVGYGTIDEALFGELGFALLAGLVVLKLLATSLTLGSGGSGGVFAPSLFMGAMLGGAFGLVVNNLFPEATAPAGAYALVGMAAAFAGGARAPITAIVILVEMTRNYESILPLGIAVLVSTVVSRLLRKDSIYTIKLRRRGLSLPDEEELHALSRVGVAGAMNREYPTIRDNASVAQLTDLFTRTGRTGFPVINESHYLVGVVTASDLARAQSDEQTVAEIATADLVVAYPDQTVHDALAQLGGIDVGRIPVVSRGDAPRLLGVLGRAELVRAYAGAVGGIRAETRRVAQRKPTPQKVES